MRRLQRKRYDADDNQEWSRGPTAGSDYRGEWKKISPAVIPMTGPVWVPREESRWCTEAASSWSVRGGIKWRAERRRPARDHPYWPSERDAGSIDSVPSPPERDRLTSIAIFGLRTGYVMLHAETGYTREIAAKLVWLSGYFVTACNCPGRAHAERRAACMCNAHHLRELQALVEIGKEVWARKMRCLLRRACHAANLAREQDAPL
jgi:hypothetical protein